MLINISQFLLQPDHLLLAFLLRNRRRKLAQLTENKWLLHNCNFKRKPVTKLPHRSLGYDVSQAVSKHNTPCAAVWGIQQKGASEEHSREDISPPCSYSFPFLPLPQVQAMRINQGNTSCAQEVPLECLDLKSTFLPHVYLLNLTILFSLWKLMRTFCAAFLLPPFPGKERSKNLKAFEPILALHIWAEFLLLIQELQKTETRIMYLFVCWTQGLLCFKPKLGPQWL